ncbi:MAG: TetR/AcrR family transcriptional regulator [Mucilaginibacter polytrichastri]|nr:TetR/AcrR family transcriptional regulator [Mucilaginibacter polytrichastri]
MISRLENKKAWLIENATRLFSIYGVRNLTMDELARETGTSKKTLYMFFATKAELVTEVVTLLVKDLKGQIRNNKTKAKNAIHEHVLQRNVVEQMITRRELFNLKDLMSFPGAHAIISAFRHDYLQAATTENLLEGLRTGVYRPDIDVPVTAAVVCSFVQFVVFDHFRNERIVHTALDLQVAALVNDVGRLMLHNAVYTDVHVS